jgi:hypothetical protein
MAPDVNAWLSAALNAGVKIPRSMVPVIETLIRTHQLTEENARALLGLADDGVPSLDAIREAADRYGLKLDELGGKVAQLDINDRAGRIVSDFNTLSSAGASASDIFRDHVDESTGAIVGMHHSLQDLVTDALNTGTHLPAALRPIIQQLIDLGGDNGLVDQFGNALTGLGDLTFDEPVSGRIDDLINAINGPGGLAEVFQTATDEMGKKFDELGLRMFAAFMLGKKGADDFFGAFPVGWWESVASGATPFPGQDPFHPGPALGTPPPPLQGTPIFGAPTPPTGGVLGPRIKIMDEPLHWVQSPGLVRVNPGDIVGMPSMTSWMNSSQRQESFVYAPNVNSTYGNPTEIRRAIRELFPAFVDLVRTSGIAKARIKEALES